VYGGIRGMRLWCDEGGMARWLQRLLAIFVIIVP